MVLLLSKYKMDIHLRKKKRYKMDMDHLIVKILFFTYPHLLVGNHTMREKNLI